MIIYKYALKQDPTAPQELDLPEFTLPLYVGQQDNQLYVWCELTNKSNPIKTKRFYVLGTGIDYATMPAYDQVCLEYIGTVQMPNHLVWHVYYVL